MPDQIDNFVNPQGFKSSGTDTRPKKINPVKAQNQFINNRMIKEDNTVAGRCAKGTQWVAKLHMCVPRENVQALRNHKRTGYATNKVQPEAKDILRDALRQYDMFRKPPEIDKPS